jgi:hypothetical protein
MVTSKTLGLEDGPQEAARKRPTSSQQPRKKKWILLRLDSFKRAPLLANWRLHVQRMIASLLTT